MAKKTKDSNLSLEERLEQALIPNWDEPYKLPPNWCWVNLGSLGTLGMGQTILSKDLKQEGIPVYSATEEDKIFGYISESENTIKLRSGDIVIPARGNSIGHVKYVSCNEASCTQTTMFFKPFDKAIGKYVYYYMLGNKHILFAYHGNAIPQITITNIIKKEIPLPPLEEQLRMVEQIEILFTKLDEAQEKAQEVVDGFEIRKAAILHKAFSGELTEKWREENDVALTSWLPCAYSELGTSKLGKMLDKSKNSGRQVPYLRNVNVRWFGFDLSDVSQMLASEEEIKLLSVKRGDVFICEGGEPGRCAIWRDSDSNMIFQKALHRFRPNDKIIGDFLCYYLYFLSVNGTLEKYFTGSTIKHLTVQSLAKIIISVPTINEQKEIVDILDRMLSKEQQAKETAEAVIEQIDTMKKAILARAFRGELGTNDPSEKSAVELLKKIL